MVMPFSLIVVGPPDKTNSPFGLSERLSGGSAAQSRKKRHGGIATLFHAPLKKGRCFCVFQVNPKWNQIVLPMTRERA